MTDTIFDETLSTSTPLPAPPWQELEQIDDEVGKFATKLQSAPWLLHRLLPSLVALAHQRTSRWRTWLKAAEACSVADLRAQFEPTGSPQAKPAPDDHESPGAPNAPAAGLPELTFEPQQDPEPENGAPAVPGVQELVEEAAAELPSESAVAVGPEALRVFSQQFGNRRLSSVPVHQRAPLLRQREDLVREILGRLGSVPSSLESGQALELGQALATLTDDGWLRRWAVLDAPLRADVLALVVSLARAAQEVSGETSDFRLLFARLSAYIHRENAGFILGMARNHKPIHGSWLKGATHARLTLSRWLGEETTIPTLPSSQPGRSLGRVTSMVTSQEAIQEQNPPELVAVPAVLVEDDWPGWPCVRAKHSVMVGGSPKEPVRRRLEGAFQLASLEWVDGDVRRVDSVSERVRGGSLDLVLVVRDFISHKASLKVIRACKARQIPFVLVEYGHGVLAVRRSIERSRLVGGA